MSADSRLDERILAYLDGGATPTEVAELEELLDRDRSVRDRFARLCEQDAALRQILSCAPAATRTRGRRGSPRPASPGLAPWIPIAIAAAAAVFILILAGALSSGPEPREPKVARPRPLPQPVVEHPQPEPRLELPKAPSLPKPKAPAPLTAPLQPLPRPEAPLPKPEPLPVPAPKPEPKPEAPTPPPPAPKATEAAVVVARVDRVKGQAVLLKGVGSTEDAKEAAELLKGYGIQTNTPESAVTLRFPDGTTVDLGGETRFSQISNGTGKRLVLDFGTVTAQVTRQPAGQAMVFVTPHAEARVLGTKLTLSVSASETRLEVKEGRVKLTRLSDLASTEVAAGQFAVASEALKPVAKKIAAPNPRVLAEDFDDAADLRWQKLEGGFPTSTKGSLEIDLSPRPGEPYGTGWHASGGLRTKQSFAVPFRVSFDVEISHKNPSLNTLVVLSPRIAGPRTVKNELAIRLRDGEYSVIVEEKHLKQAESASAAPIHERWTVEFGPKEVALSVNGKPLLRQAHGLTVTNEYCVELQGSAKMDVPAGARVRFDNVKIEP
jgi:ferric-dicitrate binding protein FerR (iron transport regulator)